MSACAASAVACAAKCRAHHWGNLHHGGLQVSRRLAALRSLRYRSDHVLRMGTWDEWYTHNFFQNLQDAQDVLRQIARDAGSNVGELLQGGASEPVPRTRWQRRCAAVLHVHSPCSAFLPLSRSLARFPLPDILPGYRLERAKAGLIGVSRLVPPRVWAAVYRALQNGWVTGRRMQRGAACLFACGGGEDSMTHYAFCPRVACFCRARLGLAQPAPSRRLSSFLLLSPPFRDATASVHARRALALYCVYSAANAARHGQTPNAHASLDQFAREACAVHPGLAASVSAVWVPS